MTGMVAIIVLLALVALLTGVLIWMGKGYFAARERALAAERASLRTEFGELAAQLLSEKERNLAAANEHSVGMLFGQLKERLGKYEEAVVQASDKNFALGEQMKSQLGELQKFSDKAQAFTAALLGGNKIQGNKGEEILAGLLERSGLRAGVEYDAQLGAASEGRPDVSLYDALNHRVILIDAKMNIKDYIAACNLPEDEAHKLEKERLLKAHAASVRRQIDNLAGKNYAQTVTPARDGYENLPLVAMFCPFNAILETALAQDPALMQYAFERRIVLVTPLTLWGYLWLVAWGWKEHEVERKFDEVRATGGEVVAALDALVNDLMVMGEALKKANAAYDGLCKRALVEKGQVSVRRVAMKLLGCGISSSGKLKQLDKIAVEMD